MNGEHTRLVFEIQITLYRLAISHAVAIRQVCACTKGPSIACQHHGSDGLIEIGCNCCLRNFAPQRDIKRIHFLGTIERNDHYAAVLSHLKRLILTHDVAPC